ncbi:MAG: exopolysaccharide biosynthesis polyprenyl glycosylphosphotransferase [Vicingaceae bacterium]
MKISPKYAHYFLASLCLDFAILYLASLELIQNNRLEITLLIWTISNLINYPSSDSRRYVSYFKTLKLAVKQLFTFLIIYVVVFKTSNSIDVKTFFTNLIAITFILFFSKLLFLLIVRLYRIKGLGFNRFIIIGESTTMQELTTNLLAEKGAGNVLEKVIKKFDNLKSIESIILSRTLNEIYCSSSAIDHIQLASLMGLAFKNDVDFYVISDNKTNNQWIDSQHTFLSQEITVYPLMDKKNILIKRSIDILLSIIVIACILSWMVPILGILIKLESKGPVFFIQPRAGREGKYFLCLKFRSMRASKDISQASKNDLRVTKIGKFIRKTSIDEFPQFINTLTGQMSVVGPRPHIKSLNDKYNSNVNNYNNRLLVKPGITGLSQVTGHRGETINNQAMQNRIRVDLLYIKNWSVWLDINILFKTVSKNLFFADSDAY